MQEKPFLVHRGSIATSLKNCWHNGHNFATFLTRNSAEFFISGGGDEGKKNLYSRHSKFFAILLGFSSWGLDHFQVFLEVFPKIFGPPSLQNVSNGCD